MNVNDQSSGILPGPSLRAHPGDFFGKALEWFTFADIFNSLVHRSPHSVAKKLAALKRCLKGECAHLVIGAGEAAYKEGLRRLKALSLIVETNKATLNQFGD